MPRVTTIEMRIRILDNDSRMRWNGGPMASPEASTAMHAALEAAEKAICNEGFTVLGAGYGATSKDYE